MVEVPTQEEFNALVADLAEQLNGLTARVAALEAIVQKAVDALKGL